MKLTSSVTINLKDKEIKEALEKASRLAMRDTVVAIATEAINASPVSPSYPSISKDRRPPTGNNKRSIKYEVSGMGQNEVVDPEKNEGAVYSTSGYGGFLETGTVKMPARPYMKPALDKEFTADKFAKKTRGYLK